VSRSYGCACRHVFYTVDIVVAQCLPVSINAQYSVTRTMGGGGGGGGSETGIVAYVDNSTNWLKI
jgi:hypothetical protein